MNGTKCILLRARLDADRFRKAEQVFQRLGMTTGDAINVFLAQVVIRGDLPFIVTAHPERVISPDEQGDWSISMGDY